MLPTIAAGEITIPLSWQQLHHGACSEHLGQLAFAHSFWCTGQACVLRDGSFLPGADTPLQEQRRTRLLLALHRGHAALCFTVMVH